MNFIYFQPLELKKFNQTDIVIGRHIFGTPGERRKSSSAIYADFKNR